MSGLLKQWGEAAWDMLGLSSYRRNAAFLKKCGVEEEYTREQHKAYQSAMMTKGHRPQSVPKTLSEGHEFARHYMSVFSSGTDERDNALGRMTTAVNTLAHVTAQDFSASCCERKYGRDAVLFSVERAKELMYLRHISGEPFSTEVLKNPWREAEKANAAMVPV